MLSYSALIEKARDSFTKAASNTNALVKVFKENDLVLRKLRAELNMY
jgi:hypothetical protein